MGRSFLKVHFSKRCHGPKFVIVDFTGMSWYVRILMEEFLLLLDCTGANLGFIPNRFRSGRGAEPAWCERTEASYGAAGGETLEAANSHL